MDCGKQLIKIQGMVISVKLSYKGVFEHKQDWQKAGFELPSYDLQQVKEETIRNPVWVHFGAGNIFRAFQANVVQELLNKGRLRTGLIAVEGYDYEIIGRMYQPHDNLGILATLKANGSVEKTVVASIMESLTLDSSNDTNMTRLSQIFSDPGLQMASFTITEKGYSLVDGKGEQLIDVARDMQNGTDRPVSYMGKVTALLYERFKAGEFPVSMVSMDNCSHNGDKLYQAIHAFADTWEQNGLVSKGFLDYVENPEKVSFPWSMIDKITPRPDASVEKLLQESGVEDLEPVITAKNTYVAPFVNAEECQYLVIEDSFPNGRPLLEEGGIIFTTRETVDRVEKMKVCTCLNPLHTALAIFGCLLDYTLISREMNDPVLKKLVEIIGGWRNGSAGWKGCRL